MIVSEDTSKSILVNQDYLSILFSNMGQKIRHLNKLKEENNKLKAEKNKAMEDLAKALDQRDKLQKVMNHILSFQLIFLRNLMNLQQIQIQIQEDSLMVQEIVLVAQDLKWRERAFTDKIQDHSLITSRRLVHLSIQI